MQNKSFTYLLPLYSKFLINESKELNEGLFLDFIENCFTYHKVNDNIQNCFILQLRVPEKNDEIFRIFLNNLKKSIIFVEQFKENEYFFIRLNIPNEIWKSYKKFITGKYSELDEKNKRIILQFAKNHFSIDFSNRVNRIFRKSPELRAELEEKLAVSISKNSELSSSPNINKETYKPYKIYE